MSGFRLQSKSAITIEVNDKGETITLDFGDPTFIARVQDMLKDIDRLKEKYQGIDNFFNGDITEDTLLSDEGHQLGQDLKNYFLEGRDVIDGMLGHDACQKIFGDNNWYLMFDDLFEQIAPYFDKAEVNFNKYLSATKKKYANRATRRANKQVI